MFILEGVNFILKRGLRIYVHKRGCAHLIDVYIRRFHCQVSLNSNA